MQRGISPEYACQNNPPAVVWLNCQCPAQEAVRDLEAVTRQRDELAARLAEAKAAGCRAGRYGAAAREEVEKLRREACDHNAALCNARSTIAGLEAQVITMRKQHTYLKISSNRTCNFSAQKDAITCC